MNHTEIRYSKVAVQGNRLTGRVMTYGEEATGAPGPEMFLPGSFIWDDVILNRQHERLTPLARTNGGGLELRDTDVALEMYATLADTASAKDTLALVKSRVLRGLSVEFRALSETLSNGVRVIEKAELRGIGVVDSPAYAGSLVEARAIAGVSIRFNVPYNSELQCECCPDADTVRFARDAFKESLDTKDILLVAGDYKAALSSKNRGTLRARETAKGLELESVLADTQAGRDILSQALDTPVVVRPILDFTKSVYVVSAGVAEVENAYLRGMLIGATDALRGWEPVQVVRDEGRGHGGKKIIWL